MEKILILKAFLSLQRDLVDGYGVTNEQQVLICLECANEFSFWFCECVN